MPRMQRASASRRFWRVALILFGGAWLLVSGISAIGGVADRAFTLVYFLPIIVAAPAGILLVLIGALLYRSRRNRTRVLLGLTIGVLALAVGALAAFVITLY